MFNQLCFYRLFNKGIPSTISTVNNLMPFIISYIHDLG